MEYKIPYKTENRTDAPEWGRFALHGEIGRRIAFYNERGVMSAHAREEVFAEARSYFRDQQDDALRVGYWRGEFWGKLMLSAARVCRMTGDHEFRTVCPGQNGVCTWSYRRAIFNQANRLHHKTSK